MSRAWAALASLPIPAWGFLVAAMHSQNRLVRYHGVQSGLWTLSVLVVLAMLGFLRGDAGSNAILDAVAGIFVAVSVGGLAYAGVGAARGRYPRLRPIWDVLTYRSGSPTRTV